MKFIFTAIIITLAGCSAVHKTEQSSNTEGDLKRKLKAGENHSYTIHLNAGEFLHLQVMQYGIDLIAKVTSADKEYAEQFDKPTGELDAEDILLLSDSSEIMKLKFFLLKNMLTPASMSSKLFDMKEPLKGIKNG